MPVFGSLIWPFTRSSKSDEVERDRVLLESLNRTVKTKIELHFNLPQSYELRQWALLRPNKSTVIPRYIFLDIADNRRPDANVYA